MRRVVILFVNVAEKERNNYLCGSEKLNIMSTETTTYNEETTVQFHLAEGTVLQSGRYRITRFIDSGGFGCTYEAEHPQLGRVAIKEFFPKTFCNREASGHVTVGTHNNRELVAKLKSKFIREAKTIYALHHPNIVHVSDVFEENDTAYYVMDYIDGRSLGKVDKLPEAKALEYILQVCDALKYLHSQSILHLDLKPANIMIDSNDTAILIDFGVSKQYDEVAGENTSTLLGYTEGYAPLEQVNRSVREFFPSTDIYALGATLYKLLSGVTPASATCRASGEGELQPLPSGVSAKTRKAIDNAMILNKNQRTQSVDKFLADLGGKSVVSGGGKVKNGKKSRKGWLWVLIGALLVIAVGTLFLLNREEVPTPTEEVLTPTEEAPTPIKKAPAPERQGWGAFPLYGDVSKVICKEDGVIDGIYYFNANGDVSKSEYYNSAGELDWRYTYRYDSAGNLIEMLAYDSDGELWSRDIYRYDSAGNQIERVEYNSAGELESRWTYAYDSAGNLIEELKYNSAGELEDKLTRHYDSAGKLIEELEYGSDGELEEKFTCRYDSAGNRIEWYAEMFGCGWSWKSTCRYDSAGKLIEELGYNSDGELEEKLTYRYDSAGNKIERLGYNSDGELDSRCTYRYDSAGNRIEELYYYPDDERESRYTYKIEYR